MDPGFFPQLALLPEVSKVTQTSQYVWQQIKLHHHLSLAGGRMRDRIVWLWVVLQLRLSPDGDTHTWTGRVAKLEPFLKMSLQQIPKPSLQAHCSKNAVVNILIITIKVPS